MESSVISADIGKTSSFPDDRSPLPAEHEEQWAANLHLPAYTSTPEGVAKLRSLAAECSNMPDGLCAKEQCTYREAVSTTMSVPEVVAHILLHHRRLYITLWRLGLLMSKTACPWADCAYGENHKKLKIVELQKHFQLYHSRDSRRCYVCRELCASNAELRRHPCIRTEGAGADGEVPAAEGLIGQWSVQCPWCTHQEHGFGNVRREHVIPGMVEHSRAAHGRSDVAMCITCITCMAEEDDAAHQRGTCPGRKCPKCEYRSTQYYALRDHVRSKHTDYEFRCGKCGGVFQTGRILQLHACFEAGVLKRHQCDLCPRTYRARHIMLAHRVEAHTNTGARTCASCGKSFTRVKSLARHVSDVHEKQRTYECPVCEQKFSQQGSVRRHMLIHLRMKPHLCQHCGDSFRQRTLLLHHMKKHHPGTSPD